MLQHFYKKALDGEINIAICRDINSFVKQVNEKDFRDLNSKYKAIVERLDIIKSEAKKKGLDEELANAVFVLKCVVDLFYSYSEYVKKIELDKYRESWNDLQDCIDSLGVFEKFCESPLIDCLANYFAKIEKLYPFKLFNSIEMKVIAEDCSICGKSMLKAECEHIQGELYWGEMAKPIVKKVEQIVGVAVVSNPKDKRCILELVDETITDEDRFRALIFCKDILTLPFVYFDIHETITDELDEYGIAFKHSHYEIDTTMQTRMQIRVFANCP